jgi:hypothetical protein
MIYETCRLLLFRRRVEARILDVQDLRHAWSGQRYELQLSVGRCLPSMLPLICGWRPGALAGIVTAPQLAAWRDYALAITRRASPEVVAEVLKLLRVGDLDAGIRREVFAWLCWIDIKTDGRPPSP